MEHFEVNTEDVIVEDYKCVTCFIFCYYSKVLNQLNGVNIISNVFIWKRK